MANSNSSLHGIEPVAIALDQIELGSDVRFAGIDLDTGLRIRVVIERTRRLGENRAALTTLQAHGLLLMLSVERINSDS